MIDLSKLGTEAPRRRRRRRGRAAKGGFSGRGTKGQKSRTAGGNIPVGFEGGQNPLKKRLPKKRGFRPYRKINYEVVNLAEIEKRLSKVKRINKKILAEEGLIKSEKNLVKILGDGEISNSLEIEADAFSKQAKEKIKKSKGIPKLISRKSENKNIKKNNRKNKVK